MTTPLASRLEELVAEYQRARTDMQSIQDKMRATKATVKSDKGMITVTVGPQGDISELTFNTKAYRTMPPPSPATAWRRCGTSSPTGPRATATGGQNAEDPAHDIAT